MHLISQPIIFAIMEAITLKSEYLNRMTEDEFFIFCQQQRDLRIERYNSKIIVMPPTGTYTGSLGSEVSVQLGNWNKAKRLGVTFDSSTGYTLPDESVLSPDASWISSEKWDKLPVIDKKKFAHICPEFVIEIKSESDKLVDLKEKMLKWIANGCLLAWLIETENETLYIYRADGSQDKIVGFDNKVSGENVLPGFEFDLSELI